MFQHVNARISLSLGQWISNVCHMVPPPSKMQGNEREGEKNRKIPQGAK